MNLKTIIKAEAKNLGFSLTGVTTPDVPDHFSFFEKWLMNGYHADQEYLSREDLFAKRGNPCMLMPDCKSIICLAFPYPIVNTSIESGPYGQVAAYATIPDYHEEIPHRIAEFMARVQSGLDVPVKYQAFTDSAPILERDLAYRAGLGWIGKNGCLIHPDHGSYFLLAEVMVDIKLEPDSPFAFDRCGTCNRCVEACPTQCILPNRMIDSGRCISYLTIEKKGEIPKGLRNKIGNWVFGCDICQMVCPWNSRPGVDLSETSGIGNKPVINLNDELLLSEFEFKIKYQSSPILRAKYKGYLRNIAIAIGNAGNQTAVPLLVRQMSEHKEPLVRAACAWALGEIGEESSVMSLISCLEQEDDVNVQVEIQFALDHLHKIHNKNHNL